jgi:aconitate hydratase
MPLTFRDEGDYDKMNVNSDIRFVGVTDSLASGGDVRATIAATGEELSFSYDLSPRQREILLAGGMLGYLRDRAS